MKLILSYQPLQLQPPFAYAVVFQFKVKNSDINAMFDLEYLGRADVSDDELIADGFTRDDDFIWKGTLNHRWISDIEFFVNAEVGQEPDDQVYLNIHHNDKDRGFPLKIDQAEILLQELMQAILETNEIESPLASQVSIAGKIIDLKWSFKDRLIRIDDQHSYEWELGRDLIDKIFNRNFESLKSIKKPELNSVCPGDGNWYPINDVKSAKEIGRLIDQLKS